MLMKFSGNISLVSLKHIQLSNQIRLEITQQTQFESKNIDIEFTLVKRINPSHFGSSIAGPP